MTTPDCVEVVCATRPDRQLFLFQPDARLYYRRIVSVRHYSDLSVIYQLLPGEAAHEHTLLLPRPLADRFFEGVRLLSKRPNQSFNCHWFSKLMHGILTGTERDFDPLVNEFHGLPALSTTLKLGALGIVSVAGLGAFHSLIGLGTPDSLQVMSNNSELGIANTDDVLDFYQEAIPEREVSLYEMADSLLSYPAE